MSSEESLFFGVMALVSVVPLVASPLLDPRSQSGSSSANGAAGQPVPPAPGSSTSRRKRRNRKRRPHSRRRFKPYHKRSFEEQKVRLAVLLIPILGIPLA